MPRRSNPRGSLWLACFLSALLLPCALALDGPRSVLLVARPGMPDANFSETVILVTQDDNSAAVGVILNRPLNQSLAELLPGERFRRFTDPMYFGGPVGANALFALFQGEKAPGPVIPMIPGVQLALDPDTIDSLLRAAPETIRFYSGYSGWAPSQLQSEIDRGDWFVLEADAETAFRKDSSRLWPELLRRARAVRTSL